MINPYYDDGNGIQIYLGDCLEIMPQLEPVDLVLTDPPYGMNNNVDSARFSGGTAGHIAKRGNGGRFKEQIIGDDKPFDPTPFIDFCHVILWGSNHYSSRLPVGSTLVWLKRLDAAFGTFLSDAEIAWMKGGCGVYCKRDLSFTKNTRERKHPNQKPIPLTRWCIKKSKSIGLILDPFMGSGTTLVAARELGRKAIGIEISRAYCDIAIDRLRQSCFNFPTESSSIEDEFPEKLSPSLGGTSDIKQLNLIDDEHEKVF